MGVAFPYVQTIMVSRRGDELRPEVGEVVARDVARHEGWDQPMSSMTGWEGVAAELDSDGFDVYLRATRRRLERYGDDPRAWQREREQMMRGTGSFAAFRRGLKLQRAFFLGLLEEAEGRDDDEGP